MDVDAAAADERADQVVVRDDAAGPEHVPPALMAARLAVHQRAIEIEHGGEEAPRLPGWLPSVFALRPGHHAVWVTLLRPRGLSGSMPRRRDNASVSNCPGTISPSGASHSGSRGPGTARLLAAARPGPPPIA